MSAFHALHRLQDFARQKPGVALERLSAALRNGPASEATFDYEQAIAIIKECPAAQDVASEDRIERRRALLSLLITSIEPSWKYLIPLGRGYFATQISADAKRVFDAAGLYGPWTDSFIRAWWDGLAQQIRASEADERWEVGRRGEDLTVQQER